MINKIFIIIINNTNDNEDLLWKSLSSLQDGFPQVRPHNATLTTRLLHSVEQRWRKA